MKKKILQIEPIFVSIKQESQKKGSDPTFFWIHPLNSRPRSLFFFGVTLERGSRVEQFSPILRISLSRVHNSCARIAAYNSLHKGAASDDISQRKYHFSETGAARAASTRTKFNWTQLAAEKNLHMERLLPGIYLTNGL